MEVAAMSTDDFDMDSVKIEYLDSPEADMTIDDSIFGPKHEPDFDDEYFSPEADDQVCIDYGAVVQAVSDNEESQDVFKMAFDTASNTIIVDNKWEVKPSAESSLERFYFKKGKNKQTSYSCSNCGLKARSLRQIATHLDNQECREQLAEFATKSFQDVFQSLVADKQGRPLPDCESFPEAIDSDTEYQELDESHSDDEMNEWQCDICKGHFIGSEKSKEHHVLLHLKHSKKRKYEASRAMSTPALGKNDENVCTKCDETFVYKANFKSHQCKPHAHACKHCPKTFTSSVKLRNHEAMAHNAGPSCCKICGKRFSSHMFLRKHCKNRHVTYCVECEEYFPSADNLSAHELFAHPEFVEFTEEDGEYTCDKCHKTWTLKRNFSKHWAKVHGTGCVHCGQDFATAEERMEHVYSEHREMFSKKIESRYFCAKCGVGFLHLKAFQRHETMPHEQPCNMCDKKFPTVRARYRHASVHSRPAKKPKLADATMDSEADCETTSKQFPCQFCEKSFPMLQLLRVHQANSHAQQLDQVADQPLWKCSECDARFKFKANLHLHMRDPHYNQSNVNYKCDFCEFNFCVKANLVAHMDQHASKMPFLPLKTADDCFLCGQCGYKSSTFNGIAKHQRSEHPRRRSIKLEAGNDGLNFGERVENDDDSTLDFQDEFGSYKCGKCHKSWTTLKSLKNHMKDVHDTVCEHCKQRFSNPEERVEHVYKAHRDALNFGRKTEYKYVCFKCGEGYTYLPRFRRHKAKPHDFACETCDKVFTKAQYLVRHEALHIDAVSNVDKPATITKQRRKYFCKFCFKLFPVLQLLKVHVAHSHAEKMAGNEKKPWECSECDAKLSNRHSLYLHMRNQHAYDGDAALECAECGRSFTSPRMLKVHIAYSHPHVPLDFKCPDCNSPFMSQSKLDDHIANKAARCGGTCDKCGKVFRARRDLDQHVKTQCGTRCYQCSYCTQTYKRKADIIAHIASVHEGKQLYHCDACDLGFDNYARWYRHKKTHQVMRCDVCDIEFKSYQAQMAHNLRHKSSKQYVCEKCHKSFASYSVWYSHQNTHKNPKWECEVCGTVFKSRNGFKYHQRTVHSKAADEKRKSGDFHTCSICSKLYKTFSGLWQHKCVAHGMSGDVYPCDQCHRVFRNNDSFQKHKARHGLEKKWPINKNADGHYTCTQCDNTWTTYNGFYQHQRKVHARRRGGKDLACDECDKTFSTLARLYKHKLRHQDPLTTKIYVCGDCGKENISRSKMIDHFNLHTGEKPHKCPHCGRCYANRLCMQNHVKKHCPGAIELEMKDHLIVAQLTRL